MGSFLETPGITLSAQLHDPSVASGPLDTPSFLKHFFSWILGYYTSPAFFFLLPSFMATLSESAFFFFNFIYFWLRWLFVAAHGLSLVVASRGYSSLQCIGFTLMWLLFVAERRL